jgi:hypothetical protein
MTINYFNGGKWQMSEQFNGTIAAGKRMIAYIFANQNTYTAVNLESDGGTVLAVAK